MLSVWQKQRSLTTLGHERETFYTGKRHRDLIISRMPGFLCALAPAKTVHTITPDMRCNLSPRVWHRPFETRVYRQSSRQKIASRPAAEHMLSDHHQTRSRMATKFCIKPTSILGLKTSARPAASAAVRRLPGRQTGAGPPRR